MTTSIHSGYNWIITLASKQIKVHNWHTVLVIRCAMYSEIISMFAPWSGAHTIGVSHCGAFSRRLYNFTGKGDADPSLNATYATFLRTQCPNPANPATTVEMDPQSSLSFDSNYFDILTENKGLFQSDAALLTNRGAAKVVQQLRSPAAFFSEFGKSMKKMGAIGVLTGTAGEIRKQCRVVN